MHLQTARAPRLTPLMRAGGRHPSALFRSLAACVLFAVVLHPAQGGQAGLPGEDGKTQGWNLHTLQNLNGASQQGLQVSGLAHAWQLAQQNDPQYRQALAELRAAQTQRRQGRANLLPQVQAGYYRGVIRGTRNLLDAPPAQAHAELDYDSETTYVQLQQPVLNYGRYAEYQRGNALAESGEAQFERKRQERFVALAEAYFNTLLAEERLRLDEALAESLAQQAAAQEALYRQDEATRIDAQEIGARLSLAQADVILARDAVRTARRELQAILGAEPERLAGLVSGFEPAMAPEPADLAAWLERGRVLNAEVRAAIASLGVANADVERARSRHMPQLDLVASWTKANSENLSTLSQNTNTYSVGLNLNIPLFAGGYDTAANARARAVLRQTRQELQAVLQTAEAGIVRHYTGVTGGAQRIAALEASEGAGTQALKAAQHGYRHGITSTVDVLKQQETLYRTRHALIKSRFDYLLSLIQLWVAAGVFDEMRLHEFDVIYISR